MKVLLDSCISRTARQQLEAAGHDVVSIAPGPDPGDEPILQRAFATEMNGERLLLFSQPLVLKNWIIYPDIGSRNIAGRYDFAVDSIGCGSRLK